MSNQRHLVLAFVLAVVVIGGLAGYLLVDDDTDPWVMWAILIGSSVVASVGTR